MMLLASSYKSLSVCLFLDWSLASSFCMDFNSHTFHFHLEGSLLGGIGSSCVKISPTPDYCKTTTMTKKIEISLFAAFSTPSSTSRKRGTAGLLVASLPIKLLLFLGLDRALVGEPTLILPLWSRVSSMGLVPYSLNTKPLIGLRLSLQVLMGPYLSFERILLNGVLPIVPFLTTLCVCFSTLRGQGYGKASFLFSISISIVWSTPCVFKLLISPLIKYGLCTAFLELPSPCAKRPLDPPSLSIIGVSPKPPPDFFLLQRSLPQLDGSRSSRESSWPRVPSSFLPSFDSQPWAVLDYVCLLCLWLAVLKVWNLAIVEANTRKLHLKEI